jgi:ribosomal protein L37E
MTGNKAKVCTVTDARTLGRLTRDAEAVCARCGAKAHNKANVCDPVPFEPDH